MYINALVSELLSIWKVIFLNYSTNIDKCLRKKNMLEYQNMK